MNTKLYFGYFLWVIPVILTLANFSGHTSKMTTDLKVWNIDNSSTDWHEVFNGFGSITYNSLSGIVLEPKTSVTPDETHAALIIANKTEAFPLKDFIVSLKVVTERQLRPHSANPWEVFWLFFNHTFDVNNNSISNYFIIKPNGIELGKAYDKTKQIVLATRTSPTLTLGKLYSITLIKVGNHVDISIDGTPILNYVARPHSAGLFDTPGAIGLYTEDARVHIYTIAIIPLNLPIN